MIIFVDWYFLYFKTSLRTYFSFRSAKQVINYSNMEPNPRQHFTTCEHCHREIRADFFAIHSARCLPADMAATRARR